MITDPARSDRLSENIQITEFEQIDKFANVISKFCYQPLIMKILPSHIKCSFRNI